MTATSIWVSNLLCWFKCALKYIRFEYFQTYTNKISSIGVVDFHFGNDRVVFTSLGVLKRV